MKRPAYGYSYPIFLGVVIAGILLISCSGPVPAASPDKPPVASPTQSTEQFLGQMLPISAQVQVANQVIQLEVAQTPEQQAMGLMYRKELAANRGMLFPFNPARPVGFWMKNCLISLDMVFLRNGKIVGISNQAPPCVTEPCPIYSPGQSVDQVIELRGGRAAELGLKVGDRLPVKFL